MIRYYYECADSPANLKRRDEILKNKLHNNPNTTGSRFHDVTLKARYPLHIVYVVKDRELVGHAYAMDVTSRYRTTKKQFDTGSFISPKHRKQGMAIKAIRKLSKKLSENGDIILYSAGVTKYCFNKVNEGNLELKHIDWWTVGPSQIFFNGLLS